VVEFIPFVQNAPINLHKKMFPKRFKIPNEIFFFLNEKINYNLGVCKVPEVQLTILEE